VGISFTVGAIPKHMTQAMAKTNNCSGNMMSSGLALTEQAMEA